MCTGKPLHQARQGVWCISSNGRYSVQEHLPPSSGKYSVACQALASAVSRYSPWYKYRNDRALLGAEEVWFLGPNSLPS